MAAASAVIAMAGAADARETMPIIPDLNVSETICRMLADARVQEWDGGDTWMDGLILSPVETDHAPIARYANCMVEADPVSPTTPAEQRLARCEAVRDRTREYLRSTSIVNFSPDGSYMDAAWAEEECLEVEEKAARTRCDEVGAVAYEVGRRDKKTAEATCLAKEGLKP